MMKKYIILSVLALFLTGQYASAQDDLNYIRSKLTVEVGEASKGVVYGSGFSMSTWRKWQGYQGGIKVSEPEFFGIAGFDKESQIAQKRVDTRNLGTILGFGGIGLAVIAIPIGESGKHPGGEFGFTQRPNEGLGVAIMLTGFTISLIGLGIHLSHKGNKYPAAFVIEVAENYNQNLK